MADETQQNQYVGPPTGAAGNPQVITVQQNQQGTYRRPKYKRVIYGLGVAEIVLGSVSILLGIVTLIVASTTPTSYSYSFGSYSASYYQHDINYIAQGIWAGVLPVVSGILGFRMKNHPSACMYNANLAMSIIASSAMLPLIALSGNAASYYYRIPYEQFFANLVALHSLLVIVGFAALVICIAHSAYCCNSFDCCQSRQLYNGPAMYNPHPYGVQQPQQMMVQLANGQYMMVRSQSMTPGYLAAPASPGPMMYQQPQGALPGQHVVGPPQGVFTHPVTPAQPTYQNQPASGGYTHQPTV